jgi:hypothetical protein
MASPTNTIGSPCLPLAIRASFCPRLTGVVEDDAAVDVGVHVDHLRFRRPVDVLLQEERDVGGVAVLCVGVADDGAVLRDKGLLWVYGKG